LRRIAVIDLVVRAHHCPYTCADSICERPNRVGNLISPTNFLEEYSPEVELVHGFVIHVGAVGVLGSIS
jgi:hypothetical protein